jgi:hypothetical protein
MKKLFKWCLVILSIILIQGCSKMDTVKLAAYHTVERYCSISDMGRVALREQVSEAVAPNSIKVNCSGD